MATATQVKEKLISTGGFTDAEVDAAFADTAGIGLPAAAGGHVEGWAHGRRLIRLLRPTGSTGSQSPSGSAAPLKGLR